MDELNSSKTSSDAGSGDEFLVDVVLSDMSVLDRTATIAAMLANAETGWSIPVGQVSEITQAAWNVHHGNFRGPDLAN